MIRRTFLRLAGGFLVDPLSAFRRRPRMRWGDIGRWDSLSTWSSI